MIKLDSMWWHESPESGGLASAHIAVLFCALVRADMIVKDLLDFEFEGIPKTFDDEKISPMKYCLAYTDGEIFDDYIVPKYREVVSRVSEDNKITEVLYSSGDFEHYGRNKTYTLVCNWHNVKTLKAWLQLHCNC